MHSDLKTCQKDSNRTYFNMDKSAFTVLRVSAKDLRSLLKDISYPSISEINLSFHFYYLNLVTGELFNEGNYTSSAPLVYWFSESEIDAIKMKLDKYPKLTRTKVHSLDNANTGSSEKVPETIMDVVNRYPEFFNLIKDKTINNLITIKDLHTMVRPDREYIKTMIKDLVSAGALVRYYTSWKLTDKIKAVMDSLNNSTRDSAKPVKKKLVVDPNKGVLGALSNIRKENE